MPSSTTLIKTLKWQREGKRERIFKKEKRKQNVLALLEKQNKTKKLQGFINFGDDYIKELRNVIKICFFHHRDQLSSIQALFFRVARSFRFTQFLLSS